MLRLGEVKMGISKFYDWKDDYKVGIDSIDQQHMKLFLMVKELDGYIEAGETHLVMKTFLIELIKYTMRHFADEEKYMQEIGVPKHSFEEHTAEHKDLVKQLKEFVGEFETQHKIFTPKLIQFLVGWLKNHIVRTDKKIIQFVK